MEHSLGAYWAGLWIATGASEADGKLYADLWEASSEIGPSLRVSGRTRSRGFWVRPPSEPAWPVQGLVALRGGRGLRELSLSRCGLAGGHRHGRRRAGHGLGRPKLIRRIAWTSAASTSARSWAGATCSATSAPPLPVPSRGAHAPTPRSGIVGQLRSPRHVPPACCGPGSYPRAPSSAPSGSRHRRAVRGRAQRPSTFRSQHRLRSPPPPVRGPDKSSSLRTRSGDASRS